MSEIKAINADEAAKLVLPFGKGERALLDIYRRLMKLSPTLKNIHALKRTSNGTKCLIFAEISGTAASKLKTAEGASVLIDLGESVDSPRALNKQIYLLHWCGDLIAIRRITPLQMWVLKEKKKMLGQKIGLAGG